MSLTLPLATTREHSPLTGIMLAAMAFALLTSVDTVFKLMAGGHPAYQLLTINGFFALIPVLGWAVVTGGARRLRTAKLEQHLIRGGISTISAFCAIFAYSRLPLADFYAIVFAGPLIVTALSAFWLDEKIDTGRWLAVLIGFAGILVVTNPLAAIFSTAFAADKAAAHHHAAFLGRMAALFSVFCYALSVIMIRRMRLGESNLAFSFYGYAASISISGVMLALWGAPALHGSDMAHLALSGVLSGVASICLMTAYHRSPVALVAPFQYTQIIWGAVAGYALWATMPDAHLLAGAVIVAASGMFVFYRETRLKEAV